MTKPDMIFASRGFWLIYAEEAAQRREFLRLQGQDMDRRKRKKLIKRAGRVARRAEVAKRAA